MKSRLLLVALILGTFPPVRAGSPADRVVIPASHSAGPRVVAVSMMHASVFVKTHPGAEVIAEVPGEARTMDGMRRIDFPGISVSERGSQAGIAEPHVLNVQVPFRNGRQRDLTLAVPVNTPLSLKTSHGDIVVEGVHGEIDATTLHGNVTLSGVSGTVVASATMGTLKVSLDRLDPAKPLSFSTLNGNIEVTLPADVKTNLKLRADRGEIWSDFDIVLTGSGGQGRSRTTNGVYRIDMERSIYGSINGGGVEASFHTVNGKILIHKRGK